MLANRTIPPVPLALGLAGLIPFWGLALGLATGVTLGRAPEALAFALAAYAAVIASFLGGIRWGIAVTMEDQARARREYVIAVVPSLLAWGLLLIAPEWRLEALAIMVIAWGLIDYGMVCREDAPEWFGRLRLLLSGGAGAALILAAIVT
jgi:hypothetical protein